MGNCVVSMRMSNSFSLTAMRNSIMISSKAGLSLLLIVSWGYGLISLAADVNIPTSNSTTHNIEELYNKVLQSSLEKAQAALQQLNNSRDFIDVEYFRELKSAEGTEGYYSAAHFIFNLIHLPLLKHEQPDQLLQLVLPSEKVAIRDFFSKVHAELLRYFTATSQSQTELMRNVTEWKTATDDGIVLSYLVFPKNLQESVPELRFNNYN